MSDNLPVFFEYNSEAEEQKLVNLFEEKTGRTLYPAQDERLLISLIEYKASLLVNKFNDAARLNLVQYSRGLILDCIGEMFDTPRLQGSSGADILQIELNTTFASDLTIKKGLEILSKDEEYTFITTEDCIIPAGETIGTVPIKAQLTGEFANAYGIDDVNILVKPISYIKSVTNINGVTGGADVEDDEPYIKRILLASEKFSCAGSKQAYIYHTLSANANIVDAQAESPILPATLNIETKEEITTGEGNEAVTTINIISNNYTVDDNGIIDNETLYANVNYKNGTFNFYLKSDENTVYTLRIPPQEGVYIYPLTEDDVTPQSVIEDVENVLTGDSVNPMTDYVNVVAPEKIDKTINLNVILNENTDFEVTSKLVNDAADEYKREIRNSLGAEILPSQVIAKIKNIGGVYDVDTFDLAKTTANINQFFNITFNINITQKGN